MRCLIFLNARSPEEIYERDFYISLSKKADRVLCADGGLNLAVASGIKPDFVIGDMDSADDEILSGLGDVKIIRYPCEKDRTDGWLALRKAVEMGCGEIVVTNAVSSVIDQTLANIQMLLSVAKGTAVRICEPDVEIFVLEGEGSIRMEGRRGERLSLLPLSERAEGIWLSGLRYTMENGSFDIRGMNGISNEMTSKNAEIRLKKGILAVFHYLI